MACYLYRYHLVSSLSTISLLVPSPTCTLDLPLNAGIQISTNVLLFNSAAAEKKKKKEKRKKKERKPSIMKFCAFVIFLSSALQQCECSHCYCVDKSLEVSKPGVERRTNCISGDRDKNKLC